jgi:hypothetical protein
MSSDVAIVPDCPCVGKCTGALSTVAASEYLGVPAGGRCGGLDSCLLPPLGRINPRNRTRVLPYLLLSRPQFQGAS